ncbi:hypothetical protein QVM52_31325, partial [Pseudomonas mosselii]
KIPWQCGMMLRLQFNNRVALSSCNRRVILLWVRGNYKYFTVEPFLSYGVDELSDVNESLMPVDYSSFLPSDITRFKKVILGHQAKDVESIARFLRDTIEA